MTRDQFRTVVRDVLRDPKLTPVGRENLILAASDEYAAGMIEQHARPAAQRGAA